MQMARTVAFGIQCTRMHRFKSTHVFHHFHHFQSIINSISKSQVLERWAVLLSQYFSSSHHVTSRHVRKLFSFILALPMSSPFSLISAK